MCHFMSQDGCQFIFGLYILKESCKDKDVIARQDKGIGLIRSYYRKGGFWKCCPRTCIIIFGSKLLGRLGNPQSHSLDRDGGSMIVWQYFATKLTLEIGIFRIPHLLFPLAGSRQPSLAFGQGNFVQIFVIQISTTKNGKRGQTPNIGWYRIVVVILFGLEIGSCRKLSSVVVHGSTRTE